MRIFLELYPLSYSKKSNLKRPAAKGIQKPLEFERKANVFFPFSIQNFEFELLKMRVKMRQTIFLKPASLVFIK